MKHLAHVLLPLLLSPSFAQQLLSTHVRPTGVTCTLLRAIGDATGDGEQDFAVLTRETLATAILVSVVIVSGETGAPWLVLPQPGVQNERDLVGIGDVNGDARSDVLLITNTLLRVFSGTNGQVLASLSVGPSAEFRSACAIGDIDGNGTGDLAVSTYEQSLGACTIRILRGQSLTVVAGLPTLTLPFGDVKVRSMGDLTGDGRQEVAACTDPSGTGPAQVVDVVTGAIVWSITANGNDSGNQAAATAGSHTKWRTQCHRGNAVRPSRCFSIGMVNR